MIGIAAGAFFARMIATATDRFDDWRTAVAVIGISAWLLLMPAALFVRPLCPAAIALAFRTIAGLKLRPQAM